MQLHRQSFIVACVAIFTVVSTGCASGRRPNSYLPIGAGALYGNNTNDGVTFTVPVDEMNAMERVRSAVRLAGYGLNSGASRAKRLRTAPIPLQGDTTIRVTVEVSSLDPSATGSSVVLTAVYSTPSGKRVNSPVIQPAGTVNSMYRWLNTFAKTIARGP